MDRAGALRQGRIAPAGGCVAGRAAFALDPASRLWADRSTPWTGRGRKPKGPIMPRTALLSPIALALMAVPALAQDPASCGTVRFSDPGWTDITATNGVATALLKGLG